MVRKSVHSIFRVFLSRKRKKIMNALILCSILLMLCGDHCLATKYNDDLILLRNTSELINSNNNKFINNNGGGSVIDGDGSGERIQKYDPSKQQCCIFFVCVCVVLNNSSLYHFCIAHRFPSISNTFHILSD